VIFCCGSIVFFCRGDIIVLNFFELTLLDQNQKTKLMKKDIGLGYTLVIVSDFKNTDMIEVCKEWSRLTQDKEDVVFRKPQWFVNNLVRATLVYNPNGLLVAVGGMIRSYEDKKPVFYETTMGEKIEVYELCSSVVLDEGMGISKRIMAERLLIAEENNWAAVVVTKNKAIKKNARNLHMVQTSRSEDNTIKTLGTQIRGCDCSNPDGSSFYGEHCATCTHNGGEQGKRIFLRVPKSTPVIELPEIHKKKEKMAA
jgi:hypothetical protein